MSRPQIPFAAVKPKDEFELIPARRLAREADLVKLRYFVGLTIEEAADVLGISEATAKRW